jgi:hypothetical protein
MYGSLRSSGLRSGSTPIGHGASNDRRGTGSSVSGSVYSLRTDATFAGHPDGEPLVVITVMRAPGTFTTAVLIASQRPRALGVFGTGNARRPRQSRVSGPGVRGVGGQHVQGRTDGRCDHPGRADLDRAAKHRRGGGEAADGLRPEATWSTSPQVPHDPSFALDTRTPVPREPVPEHVGPGQLVTSAMAARSAGWNSSGCG